eukprot:9667643-Alexandrium_andersonii.AAC.1
MRRPRTARSRRGGAPRPASRARPRAPTAATSRRGLGPKTRGLVQAEARRSPSARGPQAQRSPKAESAP